MGVEHIDELPPSGDSSEDRPSKGDRAVHSRSPSDSDVQSERSSMLLGASAGLGLGLELRERVGVVGMYAPACSRQILSVGLPSLFFEKVSREDGVNRRAASCLASRARSDCITNSKSKLMSLANRWIVCKGQNLLGFTFAFLGEL
jgi:hypothetical protein